MVYRWLTDRELFRRAQTLEPIHVEREIPLVKALQAYVRKVIGTKGIVVETTPAPIC